jgi:autoinducer 2 (AI-2) kinase
MSAEHVLALDAGTSAARALIARPGGGLVAVARRDWSYETPPEIAPFGRSLDADAFWRTLCDATREALSSASLSGSDVAAVGVTSQRLAVIIIDNDGNALYAGPNADARAIAEGFAIDGALGERVYRSGGKLPSLLLAPGKLHWLRNHEPEGFARAAAVLSLGDWVAYKLTAALRNERTLAGDCGLLDVSSGERDDALLRDIDVPLDLLPALASPGEAIGEVTSAAAGVTGLATGTPVTVAGADTQCGLLGMGIEQAAECGIVTGWSAPLHIVTDTPRIDEQSHTWASLHVVPERWVVESSTADAGRAWRWWCETLLGEREDALDEGARLAEEAPAGSANVLALLGPQRMNAAHMGVHFGGVLTTTPISEEVDRAALLRAGLENVAFALRANLQQAQEIAGIEGSRIALGGGLTRVPVFGDILATVLNRPIGVAEQVEVTALGAAMITARGVGLSDDGLRSTMRRVDPNAAWTDTYERQYNRWCALSEKLDDVMKELP